MTILSELFLALLLTLGPAGPDTLTGLTAHGSLGVTTAADEKGGNMDPDGFTAPPDDGERGGNMDPDGFTAPPDDGESGGNMDPDGVV